MSSPEIGKLGAGVIVWGSVGRWVFLMFSLKSPRNSLVDTLGWMQVFHTGRGTGCRSCKGGGQYVEGGGAVNYI